MPTADQKDFIVDNGLDANESIKLGTQTVTSLVDSALVSTVARQPANASAIALAGGASSKAYDSAELLPTSGNDSGDFGYVASTNRLYLWNGSGWYNIALVNTSPTVSTSPDSNYTIDGAAGDAVTVTLLAVDPEGQSITYTQTSDSASNFVNITQDSGVFTLTPLTKAQADSNGVGGGGTFSVTFKATDGVNIVPRVSSFTISWIINYNWLSAAQQAQLTSNVAQNSAYFGSDVSLDEDASTAAIGSYGHDLAKGVGYIFDRVNTTWSQTAKLQISLSNRNSYQQAQFGYSAAISDDGNYAVFGAPFAYYSSNSYGKAFVFKKSSGTWAELSGGQLEASTSANRQNDDRMGWDVDIDKNGTRIIVGAYAQNHPSRTDAGGAYIFKNNGSDSYTYETFLFASDAANYSAEAGTAVALNSSDGSVAAVGAPNYSLNGSLYGGIFVYNRSGTTWTQTATLQPSDAGSADKFGYSCDIDQAGTTIVGSSYQDDDNASNAGAVYVYNKPTSTDWAAASVEQAFEQSSVENNDKFGRSIDWDGNYMIIGAIGAGSSDHGEGQIWYRASGAAGGTWALQSTLNFGTNSSSDYNGRRVAISGDLAFCAMPGHNSWRGKVVSYERSGTTWTAQNNLTGNSGNNSYFGEDMSATTIDGTTYLIVSEPYNDTGGTDRGRAHIYTGKMMSSQATLVSNDIANGDQFGCSVDIHRNVAVVGARGDGTQTGAVYVFTRSGTTWTQQHKITASDGSAYKNFGAAVSLFAGSDGTNTIAVYSDLGTGASKSFYIYKGSGTSYTEELTNYVPSDYTDSNHYKLQAGSNFMALDKTDANGGNTFAFGAGGDNVGGGDTGSLYIMTRTGSTWTQQSKTQASIYGPSAGAQYGNAVVFGDNGEGIAVGAPYDDQSNPNGGVVYIVTGTGWYQKQKLTAPSTVSNNMYFGESVAIDNRGTKIIVGERYYNSQQGRAYVYRKVGSTWYYTKTIYASNPSTDDAFAKRVSLSGDGGYAALGAVNEDTASGENSGMVYIQKADVIPSGATITQFNASQVKVRPSSGNDQHDNYGDSVDISKDGSTIIVGARGASGGGRFYIHQKPTGTWTQVDTSGISGGGLFGYSVAIDADGNTAAIGAPQGGGVGGGQVMIRTFDGSNWTAQAYLTADNAGSNDWFGVSVAISDDGNTVVVGAQYEGTTGTNAGSAYVYTRSGTTWTQKARFQASDTAAQDQFSYVAISGDGSYILVGAGQKAYGGMSPSAGKAYVFTFDGTNVTQQAILTASDAVANNKIGRAVAIDGDGDTIALGAQGGTSVSGTSSVSTEGAVYIYTRTGTTWTQRQILQASDARTQGWFGTRVGNGNGAIDLSYDGQSLVVGSWGEYSGNTGAVYAYSRSGNTFGSEIKMLGSDAASSDRNGWDVKIAGDTGTIVNGTPWDDDGGTNAGSIYVHTALVESY